MHLIEIDPPYHEQIEFIPVFSTDKRYKERNRYFRPVSVVLGLKGEGLTHQIHVYEYNRYHRDLLMLQMYMLTRPHTQQN